MKPTEEALLEDYLEAVPALTIHYDKDKSVLEKRVAELAEKNEEALARKAEEADIMKKEIAELRKKQKENDERYETNERRWEKFHFEIKDSDVQARREEMRKDRERIIEIEKKLLLKERKEKGKQNNKANNKITLSGNSDTVYYRKDRQGRIRMIRI